MYQADAQTSSGGKRRRGKKSSGMSKAQQMDAAGQVLAQMQAALSGQPMMPYVAPEIHIKASGGTRNSDGTRPLPQGNNTNYGPSAGYHPSEKSTLRSLKKSGGGAPKSDPIAEAMGQLFGLAQSAAATPSVAGYSAADIQKMLSGAGAAGSPMTAQIHTIRDMNQGARNDTAKGTKQVNAMYRALAQSDAMAGNQAANAQKNLAQQINRMAATGNAGDQANAQALMADNAKYGGGIAAQLNTEIGKTSANNQAINTRQAQNFASAALSQGQNNKQYFRANKSADLLEGANRSSDMISQLQSYLQGNRDKIGELAGQRQAAVQSARASILSQVQGAQQDAQKAQYQSKQDLFSNLSDLLGMQIDRGNQQADNARQDAALKLQQQIAQNNANLAQQKMAGQGTLGYDELVKVLSSSGAFKNKSVDEIMKQLAALQQ